MIGESEAATYPRICVKQRCGQVQDEVILPELNLVVTIDINEREAPGLAVLEGGGACR